MGVIAAVSGCLARMVIVGDLATAGLASKILLVDSEPTGDTVHLALDNALTVDIGFDYFHRDVLVDTPRSRSVCCRSPR